MNRLSPNKDVRQFIHQATLAGATHRINGRGHHVLEWNTGQSITIPSTPSGKAWLNTARDELSAVTGVRWRTRRSRKKVASRAAQRLAQERQAERERIAASRHRKDLADYADLVRHLQAAGMTRQEALLTAARRMGFPIAA